MPADGRGDLTRRIKAKVSIIEVNIHLCLTVSKMSLLKRLTGTCCLVRDLIVFSESYVVTMVKVCSSEILETWCV